MTAPNDVPLVDEGLEILGEDECLQLLAAGGLGRVGVSVAALPAIFPVNYVLHGQDIIFKTGLGTKLAAATAHAVVAFECDAADLSSRTGWSVLVIGRATPVTDPDRIAALDQLGVQPWAGGDRTCYICIPVDFVSGRRIVDQSAEICDKPGDESD